MGPETLQVFLQISNKFPGEADAAGPGTTLRGAAESPPPAQPPLWAKLSKSDQEFLTKQADAVSKDEFCLWLGFW